MNKNTFFVIILLLIFSCQTRKFNHIKYLNKVNKIDSIYRFKNDTLNAIIMYQSLFKKYPPHNSYLIDEYQTYITLSNKYHLDFGGKESLYKLIPLIAPNWKYNRMNKDFFVLYKKYGIDSIDLENKIIDWKKGLNKTLIDSFSIASVRDQEEHRKNPILREKNDKKNLQLWIWTFKNYGFPSLQKIGLWGNNDTFMPMGNMLNHMATQKLYPFFKEKLLQYVKSGECTPEDYAAMIDKYSLMKGIPEYGTFSNVPIVDSVRVNKNRKKIGLPSLKHAKKIHDDYFKN